MTETNAHNFSLKTNIENPSKVLERNPMQTFNEDESSSSESELAHFLRLQDKVFSNSLIIAEIMKNLDNHDLLTLRRVNHLWSQNGFSICSARPSLIVTFSYFERKKTFYQYIVGTPGRYLPDLTDHIERFGRFPCTSFRFYLGHFEAPEIQEFLSIYGHHIKSFHYHCPTYTTTKPYTSTESLRKLFQDLPHLEQLTLSARLDPSDGNEDFKLFPEPTQLPNMKILDSTQINHPGVLKEILTATINLTRVDRLNNDQINAYLTTGRFHTVKHLYFCPEQNSLSDFSKIGQKTRVPHLQSITLDLYKIYDKPDLWPRMTWALQQILNKNKETLKEIKHLEPLAFLPELKLPILEKVKKISVSLRHYNRNVISNPGLLPHGQHLTLVFPNLLQIEFVNYHNGYRPDVELDLLNLSESVPTVKTLIILEDTGETTWITKMGLLFPEVEELHIQIMNVTTLPGIGRSIWSGFPKVQNLTVAIFRFDYDGSLLDDMDSMITGLPAEVCGQLRKASFQMSGQDVEAMREKTGICQLKGLKSLEMNVYWNCTEKVVVTPLPIFSRVSGLYGFGLTKEKLKFRLNFRNSFEEGMFRFLWNPILPYVQIV